MKEIPIENGSILSPFFIDAYDSCPNAFLQGFMGRGFTDSSTEPTYGVIQVGDFCYFGGEGKGTLKQNVVNILKNLYHNPNLIMVPLSVSWNQTLSENKELERVIRYAMNQPENSYFNQSKLTKYISRVAYDPQYVGESSSRKYVIKPIDSSTYNMLLKEQWSKDLVSNYSTYSNFMRSGMGFLALESATGIVISGASTFSSNKDSMEIQIATKPGYEGQGLATALAARFILECIKLEKHPSWDAANLASVHIAEKLGYHLKEEYVAYTIKSYK